MPGTPFQSFGDALWWSATLLTTINIGADPVSFEGRMVGRIGRAIAVAIFGYIAASIASYLVGKCLGSDQDPKGDHESIEGLSREVGRLSALLEELKIEGKNGQCDG